MTPALTKQMIGESEGVTIGGKRYKLQNGFYAQPSCIRTSTNINVQFPNVYDNLSTAFDFGDYSCVFSSYTNTDNNPTYFFIYDHKNNVMDLTYSSLCIRCVFEPYDKTSNYFFASTFSGDIYRFSVYTNLSKKGNNITFASKLVVSGAVIGQSFCEGKNYCAVITNTYKIKFINKNTYDNQREYTFSKFLLFSTSRFNASNNDTNWCHIRFEEDILYVYVIKIENAEGSNKPYTGIIYSINALNGTLDTQWSDTLFHAPNSYRLTSLNHASKNYTFYEILPYSFTTSYLLLFGNKKIFVIDTKVLLSQNAYCGFNGVDTYYFISQRDTKQTVYYYLVNEEGYRARGSFIMPPILSDSGYAFTGVCKNGGYIAEKSIGSSLWGVVKVVSFDGTIKTVWTPVLISGSLSNPYPMPITILKSYANFPGFTIADPLNAAMYDMELYPAITSPVNEVN